MIMKALKFEGGDVLLVVGETPGGILTVNLSQKPIELSLHGLLSAQHEKISDEDALRWIREHYAKKS